MIRNGMWFIQFWILFQYWYSTPQPNRGNEVFTSERRKGSYVAFFRITASQPKTLFHTKIPKLIFRKEYIAI